MEILVKNGKGKQIELTSEAWRGAITTDYTRLGKGALPLSPPPEILFHRFFQNERLSPADRQKYRGKQDLDRLEPRLRSLLIGIQSSLNASLNQKQSCMLSEGEELHFHFDYIEASVRNALAFAYEGYSFIGITMPLIESLWHICEQLSNSGSVTEMLNAIGTDQQHESTHAELFATQLSFVVSHEYSHHIRGHLFVPDSQTELGNEIPGVSAIGSLNDQAREVDADGFAVYLVLTHLIAGERRARSLKSLDYTRIEDEVADKLLLSLFILSASSFLLASSPAIFDNVTLYRLTHPPQAARMNELMKNVQSWCEQNRPVLETWLTLERFQLLTGTVREATLEISGGQNWSDQTTFFISDTGAEYFRHLHEEVLSLMKHS